MSSKAKKKIGRCKIQLIAPRAVILLFVRSFSSISIPLFFWYSYKWFSLFLSFFRDSLVFDLNLTNIFVRLSRNMDEDDVRWAHRSIIYQRNQNIKCILTGVRTAVIHFFDFLSISLSLSASWLAWRYREHISNMCVNGRDCFLCGLFKLPRFPSYFVIEQTAKCTLSTGITSIRTFHFFPGCDILNVSSRKVRRVLILIRGFSFIRSLFEVSEMVLEFYRSCGHFSFIYKISHTKKKTVKRMK